MCYATNVAWQDHSGLKANLLNVIDLCTLQKAHVLCIPLYIKMDFYIHLINRHLAHSDCSLSIELILSFYWFSSESLAFIFINLYLISGLISE